MRLSATRGVFRGRLGWGRESAAWNYLVMEPTSGCITARCTHPTIFAKPDSQFGVAKQCRVCEVVVLQIGQHFSKAKSVQNPSSLIEQRPRNTPFGIYLALETNQILPDGFDGRDFRRRVVCFAGGWVGVVVGWVNRFGEAKNNSDTQ
jgi:hypothetical protein